MDSNLMDKEVLCIIETRKIQRYMFRTNTLRDSVGGSDLMRHILPDAILYALKNIDTPLKEEEYSLSPEPDKNAIPYLTSPKIKFQLALSGPGNALCLVRTGELAQKIIRKISRYYLDHAYSLNLTAAVTLKTDNLKEDLRQLYEKLQKIKASSEILDPVGALPVIMRENRTGEPVVAFDAESSTYLSKSSMLRRKEAEKRKILFDLKDMQSMTASDGKAYLAFIHADGNNIGITISRLLQAKSDYADGIIVGRTIHKTIEQIYLKVMAKTEDELKEYYLKAGGSEENFIRNFQVLHRAGDDINLMCNANLAFPFLDIFYRNLEGCMIWEKDGQRIPLYVCAGISFVTLDSSFHSSYTLAEECCRSAKTAAKEERNLCDGLAGNWIDFQICDNPNIQELDMLRKRTYHTSEGIDLLLRPYSRNPKDKGRPFHYDELMRRVHTLKQSPLPEFPMKIMKQSYTLGRLDFTEWIYKMKERGVDLADSLGAPTFTDSENTTHAVWFDAIRLLDFVK